MKKKILVVDDEPRIRDLIKIYLEREDYEVEEAANGAEALNKLAKNTFDLIILDLMMPEVDGWQLSREIRRQSDIPIIMLTARGEEFDRLLGFDLGADDYVVKPFSPRELVARVKALLRRTAPPVAAEVEVIRHKNLTIDTGARRVEVSGNVLTLTPKEYDLLLYMARQPSRVFNREQLLQQVWGYDFYGDARTVDTHVKNLREKLRLAGAPNYIQTVWGVGYKFEVV